MLKYKKINCEFTKISLYSISKASIVVKTKYLIIIKSKLYTLSNVIYIIVIFDDSFTLFGNYIFNFQNDYALIRFKSNFTYIFSVNFSLDCSIKFKHNN